MRQRIKNYAQRILTYIIYLVMCLIPLGVTHLVFKWPLLWCFAATGVFAFALLTTFMSNLPAPPVSFGQLAPYLAKSILSFLAPLAVMTAAFLLLTKFLGGLISPEVVNGIVIVIGGILLFPLFQDTTPRFVNKLVRGRSRPATLNAIDPPIELPEGDEGIFWGGTLVPSEQASNHFMVVGATGSGKTITIRLLMQRVLRTIGTGKNHRALI